MSEPSIKIDFPEAQLKALVEGWVMQQMTGEQKERILSQAIAYLMTPDKPNQYDREPPKSPLQIAFNRAVGIAIEKVANEMIMNNTEVQAKLHTMMGEALTEWMAGNSYEPFVQAFSDAMYKTRQK